MSDEKKAELAMAKLDAQVAQAGLHIVDGPNPAQHLGANDHEIWGTLSGTHSLTATHSMFNDTDIFDFTVSGGHDFNVTIAGFHPQPLTAVCPIGTASMTCWNSTGIRPAV